MHFQGSPDTPGMILVLPGLNWEKVVMAKGFRSVKRDQLFLLPQDMRRWLPDDHLAWVIISVVESLDLRAFVPAYPLGEVGRRA